MILADKIIAERKKNGWSQEELAEKIGVTRQAVSKWEGAQTTPDLQKLLQMSKVFGVSADYLLKDEIDAPDYMEVVEESLDPLHKVSMEEANRFLQIKKETAPKIAIAVFLCILSPICLINLAVCAEMQILPISEDMVGGIGMIALLILVAIATAIFILCDSKTKEFDYLEKEAIETEYGVTGMVKERKKQYEATYTRYNVLGTVICILGIIPLFACAFFSENDFLAVIMVSVFLVLEGIGTTFFILGGVNQASFDKLLQEGDYTLKEKKNSTLISVFSTAYWLFVTAAFLIISFITEAYKYTGYIWIIAGILYPAILAFIKYFSNKE